MKTRRIAAAVLLALAPQVVALPALAQADDPVTVQARARFKEGVDYYDKGQYENARLAFLQAYALKKHPAVLLNLAQSSSKSGHLLEASKYFQQFLRESSQATPEEKRDAEQGLADVRSKLGHIEIVAPAGTEITLDDKDKLGTAPFAEPVDVEPGSHTLKSSTETRTVTATAGQKVQAKFGPGTTSGGAAVAPVPAPTGGAAPGEPPPNDAAAADANAAVTAPPPGADKNKPGLLSPPETMAPVYAGLVVGGLGLVGAIVFAAFKSDAQSKADSVANEIRGAAQQRGIPSKGVCTSSSASVQKDFGNACQTLEDNNSKVDTNATIENVWLVVMGVGLVTAAGWYLFGPKKEADAAPAPEAASPSLRVEPYAGWRSGGVNVGGTF
jgi:hypothetical protein